MRSAVTAELEDVLGASIASVDVELLPHAGYSGALLERLDVQLRDGRRERLIRKRVRLAADWTAYRTDDVRGRQSMLLGESRLSGVWEVFESPYLAWTESDGEITLLMRDLGEWLLPDADEPLDLAQEDRLLAALARLHAHYWQCHLLDELEWLAQPRQLLAVLGPGAPEARRQAGGAGPETSAPEPYPLQDMVSNGWSLALDMLPRRVADWLVRAPDTLTQSLAGLPQTLVHGDAKIANFALLPGSRLAAIDWAWIGAAPCTLDVGWYIAVNAGRLARPKEEVLRRYRALLHDAVGEPLSEDLWRRLRDFAVLSGARMLLWEKALATREGSVRAGREFAWWAEAVEQLA